jgi:hypothetical protein
MKIPRASYFFYTDSVRVEVLVTGSGMSVRPGLRSRFFRTQKTYVSAASMTWWPQVWRLRRWGNDVLTSVTSRRGTNWNGSSLNPGSMRDNTKALEPKICIKFPSLLRRVRSDPVAEENCITAMETLSWSQTACGVNWTAQWDQFSQEGHCVVHLHVKKVKVKFALEQATKAQRRCRVQPYSFFNLGARCDGWSTPRPGRFTSGKETVPTA